LNVLHKEKIVHRNKKLENVFILKKEHCKVGDFSISKELERRFVEAITQAATPVFALFFSLFGVFHLH
jgi:serine/threonine protein kinase